ncbi:MAG: EscU/YscU/HrcU family type III secretion system export apparatus switch protein [Parashewanella sp.]
MADEQKTEKPTEKRIRDARKKGQVIQSNEIVTGLEMAAIMAYFIADGHAFFDALVNFISFSINTINLGWEKATEEIYGMFIELFLRYFGSFGLFLSFVIIMGHVVQTGPLWASEALEFKLDKLNVVNNLKQLFSMKSVFELLKNIFKVLILSLVFYYILGKYSNSFQYLPICNEECGLKVMMTMILWLWGCFVGCYLLFGIADYAFQRYTTMEDLKMSKQETKQEHKDTEGSPEIKQKRRETQREVASGSLASNVKRSSAVVRNPNHIAVCIHYDAQESPIPKVLEKAKDHMALQIVDIAERADVPVVENVPLARTLYSKVPEGDFIPEELFEPVAELLRIVMSLDYDDEEDEDENEEEESSEVENNESTKINKEEPDRSDPSN